LNIFASTDLDLRGTTLTDIETINLTRVVGSDVFNLSSTFQQIKINSGTTITGLTTVTGSVDANDNEDDVIEITGDRDFSGVTFSTLEEIHLDEASVRQTLGASSTTSFGAVEIDGFTVGSGSTTDVFDYTSNLTSGNGTPRNASSNLDSFTVISSGNLATNVISNDSNAVIEFETSELEDFVSGLDFTATKSVRDALSPGNDVEKNILTAAEALLEDTSSNAITGGNFQVTQGGNGTDVLLIFYESDRSTADAAIIRYQESGLGADFADELSLVAIFENVGSGGFDAANII